MRRPPLSARCSDPARCVLLHAAALHTAHTCPDVFRPLGSPDPRDYASSTPPPSRLVPGRHAAWAPRPRACLALSASLHRRTPAAFQALCGHVAFRAISSECSDRLLSSRLGEHLRNCRHHVDCISRPQHVLCASLNCLVHSRCCGGRPFFRSETLPLTPFRVLPVQLSVSRTLDALCLFSG